MAKATVTVTLDDGTTVHREMEWERNEAPSADDWEWLRADIAEEFELGGGE